MKLWEEINTLRFGRVSTSPMKDFIETAQFFCPGPYRHKRVTISSRGFFCISQPLLTKEPMSRRFNFRGTFTLCYPDSHEKWNLSTAGDGLSGEARTIKSVARGYNHTSDLNTNRGNILTSMRGRKGIYGERN